MLSKILTATFLLISINVVCAQNLSKLQMLEEQLGKERTDTGRIVLYYKIAYELQFNNIEKSAEFAELALSEAERVRFPKGQGNALIQLGNIEQIKGNYDEAEKLNLRALAILEKTGDLAGPAICYNNLGILYHNRNDYTRALSFYRRSLNINNSINRKQGSATALFCIGTVMENQAKYDSALVYYLSAESISESINDTRLIAYAKISLANVNFIMGDYARAFRYNEEAVALYEAEKNYMGLIKVYISLGQIAEQLDSTGQAIWFYSQSARIAEAAGSRQDVASAVFSVGQLFENEGAVDSAAFYYNKALKTFSETGNRENLALAYIALARISNLGGKHKEALLLTENALNLALETGSPTALTGAYSMKALTLSKLKNFEGAFEWLNRYSDLRDSLMSVEKQKQILELQTRYETERKEAENMLLKKDKQLLQNTRNYLVILAALLVLVAVVILRSLTVKKRDNRLLKSQKEEIERQKDLVEVQKTSITDSIRYAKRIQTAMLPPQDLFNATLKEHFILYLPRDIVSGDFYWIKQLDSEKTLLCAADCTGHGVPGAFMSMLGMSLLSDIINNNDEAIIAGSFSTGDILNSLRQRIKHALRQTGREGESRDGMDMSLCIIDHREGKLFYSGANNPVYIVSSGELTEIKATRNPIGIYLNETGFATVVHNFSEGAMLYMFSDGYSDQLSPEGSKFLSKNFKKLVTEISNKSASEVKEILMNRHLEWRKEEEQVDDIVVIGCRLCRI
jgi:serine phosphatase RsbU (regulator of sigma subunit)